MAEVELHGAKAAGRVALVDDADLELVSGYRWYVDERQRPGAGHHGPYAATNIRRDGHRTMVRMHQLITGWPQTDHDNGDGLDNQRHNLRPATHPQNGANMRGRKTGTSQYIGVSWIRKNQCWRAQISKRHLGCFTDEVEAARTRDMAAIEVYGEFAVLNFPLAETGE